MESLRQTEKGLKNDCKIFEERIASCREVLPLSEQIVRLRIGIGELLAKRLKCRICQWKARLTK
jgi:hypothetical protein